MRILVLGGTGWLGAEFTRRALGRGHSVTCLARGASGAVPDGAGWIRADRAGPAARHGYARAAGDADGPAGGGAHFDAVLETASQPGQVRDAARSFWNARRYVYVSSISAYMGDTVAGQDEEAPRHVPLHADTMASLAAYGPAKVACEQAVLQVFDDRAAVVRPGLIGGPGDPTGRTGYWPLRFARPAAANGDVLVPDAPEQPTQMIDVRDLSAWLLLLVEQQLTGIFNAVGETVPLAEHLALAAAAGAGTGGSGAAAAPAAAPEEWLLDQGVRPWAGPRSLPLWLGGDPALQQHGTRSGQRARDAGLETRPLADTLSDALGWELRQGIDRPRNAGLSRGEERELLSRLHAGARR